MKKSWFVKVHYLLVVVFILLSAAIVYAQSSRSSQPETKSKSNTSTQNQQPSDKPTLIDKIPASKPSQQSGAGNQANAHVETPDERIATFTFWLVIVASIQAAIFIAQLIAMGVQAKRLRETVEATKKAADALPMIERAYLFVDFPDVQYHNKYDSYEIILTIRNQGKTPAVIIGVYADIVEGTECPANISEDRRVRIPEGTVVIAGEPVSEPIYGPGAWNLPGIGKGPLPAEVICFGRVDYKDIFEEKREVRFCFHHDPEGIWGKGITFRICGKKYNYYT